MKTSYCTLFLLMLSGIAFSQTKISFDLQGKSVLVNNVPQNNGGNLNMVVKKNTSILLSVSAARGQSFTFILSTGPKKIATFTEKNFPAGGITTDKALKYNGNFIYPNFTVTMLPFKKSFHINIDSGSTGPSKKIGVKSQPADKTVKIDTGKKIAPKLIYSSAYQLGAPYYDAYALKNYKSLSPGLLDSILAYYFANGNGQANQMLDSVKSNPFLKLDMSLNSIITVVLDNRKKDSLAKSLNKLTGTVAQGAPSITSNLGSSIGGLDVTNIADGIAKFLINRGKQELSMAFFDKFKDIINKNKDLKILFPGTVKLLNAVDQDIYNYTTYLQNLRDAFQKDIAALPKNFPGIIDSNQTYFNEHPKLRSGLLGACYLANEIENRTHPGDILANFPDSLLDQFSDTTRKQYYFKGAIQTLQLLSSGLRDTTSGDNANYWVSIAQIRKLVNDKEAFNIFLGLVYQKAFNDYSGVSFDERNSLTTFLKKIANKKPIINTYSKYISGFGSRIDELNKMIKNYQSDSSDSSAVQRYAKYFTAVTGLLEYSSSITDLPLTDKTTIGTALNLNFKCEFKQYFDISDDMTSLITDIEKKNYSGAINDAVSIYGEVTVKQTVGSCEIKKPDVGNSTASSSPTTTAEASKKDAKVSTSKKNTTADTSQTHLQAFIKYGSFMANVATAKNSDDVQKAIDAVALPPGSYSIKQKSIWNISLNAYVGYGADINIGQGITAPIGFSGTLGNPHGVPVTFFVGIIDVGALVSYRLNDTTSTLKQQITLESIVAPSAQVFFEIPKWPLAIGAGWRMTPKTSYSKASGVITVPSKSAFNISILIDIPIFTLHNSSR